MPHSERIPWLTIAFLVALFVLLHADFYFSLQVEDSSWREEVATVVGHGDIKYRMTFVILLIYGSFGMLRRGRRRLSPSDSTGWLMLAFLGLTFFSILWSQDPGLTARRLFVFGSLCFSALAFASRSSLRDPILLAIFCCGTYLLAGAAAEFILGTMSPWIPEYRFAGVGHPNKTGLMAAIFVLACAVFADSSRTRRWFFYGCMAIGFALLVLTKSRGSLISFFVGFLFYKNLVSNSSRKLRYLFVFGVLVLVLLTLFGNDVFVASREGILLGRSEEGVETLSGRTELWRDCIGYVWEKPFLGYGFSSFWTPNMIDEISFSQGWGLSSSHSVYLEYALNLGLIGLMLFLALMWTSISKGLKLFRKTEEIGYAFVAGFLLLTLTNGLLDTVTMSQDFPLFLTVVCLVKIGFVARVRQNPNR